MSGRPAAGGFQRLRGVQGEETVGLRDVVQEPQHVKKEKARGLEVR